MTDQEIIPFMINQVVFDHLAAMEGQVVDGLEIHAVDREAGTVQVGGTLFQAVKLIPCEIGTIERFEVHISSPDDFAPQNIFVKPRGAQWKRERNRWGSKA